MFHERLRFWNISSVSSAVVVALSRYANRTPPRTNAPLEETRRVSPPRPRASGSATAATPSWSRSIPHPCSRPPRRASRRRVRSARMRRMKPRTFSLTTRMTRAVDARAVQRRWDHRRARVRPSRARVVVVVTLRSTAAVWCRVQIQFSLLARRSREDTRGY